MKKMRRALSGSRLLPHRSPSTFSLSPPLYIQSRGSCPSQDILTFLQLSCKSQGRRLYHGHFKFKNLATDQMPSSVSRSTIFPSLSPSACLSSFLARGGGRGSLFLLRYGIRDSRDLSRFPTTDAAAAIELPRTRLSWLKTRFPPPTAIAPTSNDKRAELYMRRREDGE